MRLCKRSAREKRAGLVEETLRPVVVLREGHTLQDTEAEVAPARLVDGWIGEATAGRVPLRDYPDPLKADLSKTPADANRRAFACPCLPAKHDAAGRWGASGGVGLQAVRGGMRRQAQAFLRAARTLSMPAMATFTLTWRPSIR